VITAALALLLALPLAGRAIAVDPGHNGGNIRHTKEINRLVDAGGFQKACDTTGTATSAGYTEAAYNLDVSRRLAAILRRRGARVILTRRTNAGWGPCIDERARVGNRAKADVAVSIHADGGPSRGRGFHVIYRPGRERSFTLALYVRDAFRAVMPVSTYAGRDGLAARTDIGGLNLSRVPKVLVETGNMRNVTDARLLSSPRFRQREATALAAGITTFLR
jgi:N-acetylmuramoyl-L-alanine amidase